MKTDLKFERRSQKYIVFFILILVVLVLLVWLLFWQPYEYTNDAYVQGNQVYIKPLRSGFVTGVHSDDTFFVRKGQLLVNLNETDNLIALEKAKAHLAQTVREVCQVFHEAFREQAEIGIRKAQFLKAKQNFEHRAGVVKARGVSVEDYQNAADDLKASAAALTSSENNYQRTLAFIQNSSIVNHPVVQKAAQDVRDTWVQLYRSKIYAPVDGIVAQRTIQVGMFVNPTDALMAIIPLNQLWVNANFKETQLKHVRIGQPVTITSDLYGRGVVFHGRVIGLPGGAGNVFSLLPPENLSGNWIKIVQRLPVRIALNENELRKYPLRLGLSLEVTVDFSDQSGPLLPKSNLGPSYTTDIFKQEEAGNRALIQQIILANLDPTLKQYAYQPLNLKSIQREA